MRRERVSGEPGEWASGETREWVSGEAGTVKGEMGVRTSGGRPR